MESLCVPMLLRVLKSAPLRETNLRGVSWNITSSYLIYNCQDMREIKAGGTLTENVQLINCCDVSMVDIKKHCTHLLTSM